MTRQYDSTGGICDLKDVVRKQPAGQDAHAPDRRAFRWTPRAAMAGLIAAMLFAWGFLHVALTLIFASRPIHH